MAEINETGESRPNSSSNFLARLKNRLMPQLTRKDGSSDYVPRMSWQEINKIQADFNEKDLEKRKKEIEESGLKENYKGDFMGMQVFEGKVELRDYRNGKGKYTYSLAPVNVRIIAARDMHLPTKPSEQHGDYSNINKTLFADLFYTAEAQALYTTAIQDEKELNENSPNLSGTRVLATLTEQYKVINNNGEVYPLTIIYGHGDVDKHEQHLIHSGVAELYPTNMVLNNLLTQFPPPENAGKIPVLLTSCNDSDGRKAHISNPSMIVGYRDGISGGGLRLTGKAQISGID